MDIARREMLVTSIAATAGWLAARGATVRAAEEAARPRLGLQLYAVRGEFSRDVPGTIAKVGQLGYEGVEFWGYGGTPNVYQEYSAPQLRKLLDDHGLKCCGMHLQLKALEPEQLPTTIENNRVLGNRFLIVAAAKEKMGSEQGIKELAEFLNASAERCRQHGMRVGYHAHGFDFVRIGDRTAWEILFSQVNPEILMQIDVANALSGGGDPAAMLEKFPGRAATIHVREYEEKTFDGPYYTKVFQLCAAKHPTEWYIVEAGGDGGQGFEIPAQALEGLRRLRPR